MKTDKKKVNKPVAQIRSGLVSASIWKNAHKDKDGKKFESFSVSFQRSYKNDDAEWEHTQSFSANDIGRLQVVLSEVAKTILLNAPSEESEDSDDDEDDE